MTTLKHLHIRLIRRKSTFSHLSIQPLVIYPQMDPGVCFLETWRIAWSYFYLFLLFPWLQFEVTKERRQLNKDKEGKACLKSPSSSFSHFLSDIDSSVSHFTSSSLSVCVDRRGPPQRWRFSAQQPECQRGPCSDLALLCSKRQRKWDPKDVTLGQQMCLTVRICTTVQRAFVLVSEEVILNLQRKS